MHEICQENHWNCCVKMRFLGAKYARNAFAARALPRSHCENLQRSPRPPIAEFMGPTFKRRRGQWWGEGRGSQWMDGKGGGVMGKRKGHTGTSFSPLRAQVLSLHFQSLQKTTIRTGSYHDSSHTQTDTVTHKQQLKDWIHGSNWRNTLVTCKAQHMVKCHTKTTSVTIQWPMVNWSSSFNWPLQ